MTGMVSKGYLHQQVFPETNVFLSHMGLGNYGSISGEGHSTRYTRLYDSPKSISTPWALNVYKTESVIGSYSPLSHILLCQQIWVLLSLSITEAKNHGCKSGNLSIKTEMRKGSLLSLPLFTRPNSPDCPCEISAALYQLYLNKAVVYKGYGI
jgi:hypothetical protein